MKHMIMLLRTHHLCVVTALVSVVPLSSGEEERGSNNSAALSRVESAVAEQVVEVIRAKRAGTLIELLVKPGDVVSKDQMLGHLELVQAKLDLDMALANLEAKGTLNQMFWQYQALIVARKEAEDAVHKRTAPKSRLEYAIDMENWAKGQYEAQQDLKKIQKISFEHYQQEHECRLFRSSIDGLVTEVKVAVGQAVGIGAPVFTVSDNTPLSVLAKAAVATAAPSVKSGKLPPRPTPQK